MDREASGWKITSRHPSYTDSIRFLLKVGHSHQVPKVEDEEFNQIVRLPLNGLYSIPKTIRVGQAPRSKPTEEESLAKPN